MPALIATERVNDLRLGRRVHGQSIDSAAVGPATFDVAVCGPIQVLTSAKDQPRSVRKPELLIEGEEDGSYFPRARRYFKNRTHAGAAAANGSAVEIAFSV